MNDNDNPSKASLEEIPELDFSKVKYVGRGLYTHLQSGDEESQKFSGRFVIRLPKGLHRSLVKAASRNGVSLNMFVATALAHAIGLSERQEPEPGSSSEAK